MRVRILYPALVTLGLTLMGCHKQAAPVTTPSTAPGNSGTGTTPTTATSGAGNRSTPNDPGGGAEAERKMALATMGETIHFEYNRFDIRPSDQVILDAKAGLLTKYPSLRIRVSGHPVDWVLLSLPWADQRPLCRHPDPHPANRREPSA